MKAAVLQSNYIPWAGYFELIDSVDIFCFYDEVKYTKNDWRNRNRILGPNGPFWSTIPVSKEAVNKKISEVGISDHKWQALHYRSIRQSYAKTLGGDDDLWGILELVYMDKTWTSLSQLNQFIVREIAGYLGITTKIVNSADYNLKEGRVNRLVDLLLQLGSSEYVSGPSGMDYLNKEAGRFEENGIQVSYIDYNSVKRQTASQVSVSVLDLLMRLEQTEALDHLRHF